MLAKFFLKSKTVMGNISVGVIVTILNLFGIDLPVELITAILVVMNLILRMVTKVPISEK